MSAMAQTACPVVGESATITGQISIFKSAGLDLNDLHAKTFPNRFQPICLSVKPYIGAGNVGRVDRTVATLSHIWLVSPKQVDGTVDWKHPDALPVNVFVEVTGKLIGQGNDFSKGFTQSVVTLEVTSLKNVDAEITGAVDAWREDCLEWIESELPKLNAPPGTQAKVINFRGKESDSIIEPFASVNGVPYPKCSAMIGFYDAKGYYNRSQSIARPPYVVGNRGGIGLSPP
jgi:hypothetical protein